MFSKIQQKAIREKTNQLKRIKQGMPPKELAEIITRRRVSWIKDNLENMLNKYKGLSPEETAYKIIFFEHMKIDPNYSKMKRIFSNKIQINSYNFCPYLEACKKLNMEIKFVCKEIGEHSIQEMIKFINPNLRFGRNYNHLRPNADFCEEYIELIL